MLAIGGKQIKAPEAVGDPKQIFEQLGKDFNINAKVIKYPLDDVKVTSLEDFFRLIGSLSEVESVLVSKISDLENKPLEISRIRQAWVAINGVMGELENDRKKAREGIEDDLDKLLSQEDLDALYDNFWKRYKLVLPPARDPGGDMVSRVTRETDRFAFKVYDVLKAKSQVHQATSTRKNPRSQAQILRWSIGRSMWLSCLMTCSIISQVYSCTSWRSQWLDASPGMARLTWSRAEPTQQTSLRSPSIQLLLITSGLSARCRSYLHTGSSHGCMRGTLKREASGSKNITIAKAPRWVKSSRTRSPSVKGRGSLTPARKSKSPTTMATPMAARLAGGAATPLNQLGIIGGNLPYQHKEHRRS